MTERKTYEVLAERDDRFWLLDVPAVERVTQARRLDQAEGMARSLISIMTGEPEDSFDVVIRPSLEPRVGELVTRAVAARGLAAAAQAEASNATRSAAKALTSTGLTIRDAGDLLGMTHQRVSQLLSTPVEEPMATAVQATLGQGSRSVDVFRPGRRRHTTVPNA